MTHEHVYVFCTHAGSISAGVSDAGRRLCGLGILKVELLCVEAVAITHNHSAQHYFRALTQLIQK